MNANETWNYIVSHYEKNMGAREETVQNAWESFLSDAELFQYSRLKGEIESQRSIQIGSTERVIPDIILRKNNEDIAVIELKQYSLPFSEAREAQLFSYLKLLRIPVGVLVCDKIYVYLYDFDASEQNNRIEIPFEKDNKDGIAFAELLHKNNCTKENIERFINTRVSFQKNVAEIQRLLDTQFVIEALKAYLADKYTEEEIKEALGGMSFTVGLKNNTKSHFSEGFGGQKTRQNVERRNPMPMPPINTDSYKGLKIGEIARTVLRKVLESGTVSEEEIALLQTPEYSKKMFDIQFPLLVSSHANFDRVRYYAQPLYINGKTFYLCSQWYEVPANNDRPYLVKWIENHK